MLSHYGIFARYVIVLIIMSVKSVLLKSLGRLRLEALSKTGYGPMSYIGLTLRPKQMAWFIYRNIAWSVSVAIRAFG